MAAQSDFAGHAEDKTIHLTEEERIAWNAKADASALSGKVDTDTFRSHETNTTVHVSLEEKEKWNARNTKGAVVATQDGLDEHTENTTVHITEEERQQWNSQLSESDIRTLVDARLYEAGVEIKKLKSSNLDFPAEGGQASLIVDTNVPFLPYWLSLENVSPTPFLPPNATVTSTEKGLEIEVAANKSVRRIIYFLKVYAGDHKYGPWSEMGSVHWVQNTNAVGNISVTKSGEYEYDFIVTCNYSWRLVTKNVTVVPSSGEAGTVKVHGITTSDPDNHLKLIAMDNGEEECIHILSPIS